MKLRGDEPSPFRNSFKYRAFVLYQAGESDTILPVLTSKLEKVMALQMLDSFPGSLLKTISIKDSMLPSVCDTVIYMLRVEVRVVWAGKNTP